MSMKDIHEDPRDDFTRCGHTHGGQAWWCTRRLGHTGSCAAEPYVGQDAAEKVKTDGPTYYGTDIVEYIKNRELKHVAPKPVRPDLSKREQPLAYYVAAIREELTKGWREEEGDKIDDAEIEHCLAALEAHITLIAYQVKATDRALDSQLEWMNYLADLINPHRP